MPVKVLPRLSVLILPLVLAACQVPVYMGGHSDDFGEIVTGSALIDPAAGTGPVTATFEGAKITCKGNSKVISRPRGGGIGDIAEAELTCSDGRKGTARMENKDGFGGDGEGADECGNRFSFVWHMDNHKIQRETESFRQRGRSANASFVDQCQVSPDTPEHRDPLG
jgi:hypothetical protein